MRSRESSADPPLITLTTDFGLIDTYVGVMKGVILGIAPQARLVDLTHDIAPQNVLEASVCLEAAIDYFPEGTIHLVVVDPGVGTERAAIVVQTETCRFVAPDNGVLTLPLRRRPAQRVVQLGAAAQPYFRQPVSATFHGRDVFAPIAAHLAAGVPLDALGDPISPESLTTLPLPEPRAERTAARAFVLRLHILYTDRFGNLITDLTHARWAAWQEELGGSKADLSGQVAVQAGDRRWQGIARTFADVADGSPLAYWGSAGRLEIAIRNGNAAWTLRPDPEEELLLAYTPRDLRPES